MDSDLDKATGSSSIHFVMSLAPLIKQICAIRRKPGLTRKEYMDYRYRIHGAIVDAPENKDEKPHKYIQTQVFDSVFGARDGGPLNANQHWFGRDDVTELFFRDWGHVMRCFTSDYVTGKVGPDGIQFADYETNIVLMAYEKDLEIATRLASRRIELGLDMLQGRATVAQYFISSAEHGTEGEKLEPTLTPLLRAALEQHCHDDVWGLMADIGVESDKFDLASYFGGRDMPRFCLVYKIFLHNHASVPKFRRSQHSFEDGAQAHFDLNSSFVLFAEEALVMDVDKDIRFALDRQLTFPDLPGPTHLQP